MPQLYMRLSTFLTASLARTLSPVIGHMPPFAKVPAITDMLSQFISKLQVWRKKLSLNHVDTGEDAWK